MNTLHRARQAARLGCATTVALGLGLAAVSRADAAPARADKAFPAGQVKKCQRTTYTEQQVVVPCTTTFPASLRDPNLTADYAVVWFDIDVTLTSGVPAFVYIGGVPSWWVYPSGGIAHVEDGTPLGEQVVAAYDSHGVLLAWDTVTVLPGD